MFTERKGGGEYGTVQAGISFLPYDVSSPGFKEQSNISFYIMSSSPLSFLIIDANS